MIDQIWWSTNKPMQVYASERKEDALCIRVRQDHTDGSSSYHYGFVLYAGQTTGGTHVWTFWTTLSSRGNRFQELGWLTGTPDNLDSYIAEWADWLEQR